MTRAPFTGRTRERATPRSVRRTERLARVLISAGGAGTIGAVALIFVFLLWVVAPLFRGARAEESSAHPVPAGADVLATEMDEYGLMAWVLRRDGSLTALQAADGAMLREIRLFEDRAPTCWTFLPGGVESAFGYADGSIRGVRIRFQSEFLAEDDVPEDLRGMTPGEVRRHRDGLVQVTPEKQWRFQRLVTELGEPLAAGREAVRLVDVSDTPSARVYGVQFV
mgnify:FL=1